MPDALAVFHFIRPLWLIALVPVALIWWRLRSKRRGVPGAKQHGIERIAPHLAAAMTVSGNARPHLHPVDSMALMLGCLVLAVAGPTWSREANPLLAQTAPLVVAVKVTPSMQENDLQPDRLSRAAFKILGLLDRRAGGELALLAYAGSAHRVTPLTEDPNIVRSYLSGLSPDIMPEEGDRADLALALAQSELARAETPGAILFVLDDLAPANVAAFNTEAAARPPVVFFVVSGASRPPAQLDRIDNATVVPIAPDTRDLRTIEARLLSAYREALIADPRQDWRDQGWIFAWPALLLLSFWFRRGWTMRSQIALLLLLPMGQPAQAGGWQDWFFTADQQGQRAMDARQYSKAADLFSDPGHRAYALLRAGRYEEAAEAYAALETAAAANAQGIALLRSRKYRDGVRAFEAALERDPSFAPARANLPVARAIVAHVERQQSQSDTGEEGGIGADETVFDNESGMGAQTDVDREEDSGEATGLSTEDWMRAVDTQIGDFLSQRFLLETTREAE